MIADLLAPTPYSKLELISVASLLFLNLNTEYGRYFGESVGVIPVSHWTVIF